MARCRSAGVRACGRACVERQGAAVWAPAPPGTQIATLVERHSRFVMLVRLPTKESATVARALTRQVKKPPKALRRSLTWDRGLEMAKHQHFSLASDT